ncbi:glycoside hydrolase family 38 protein [Dissoconium aciculare CBS 342.82]|uniref:Alpha-mannosidase n=1 Tax=Dissoconium aciculare CBS 342.82 TaxID=1314786 RepID=A0A6J3LVQ7_9PEZI|nr:glycoside hydrolase family 38 protein [Dissoconium aciculare CBS 342.82]KAF1819364.1 glycoside hydrolase family 38 protein [Dissoconium aciculare CBS 342.82]
MGGDNKPNSQRAGTDYPQLATRPKGKQISDIYRNRLGQFVDNGQYKEQGLLAKLDDERVSGEPHVKISVWSAPELTRPTFQEATKQGNKYRATSKGASFGPSWSTHWFKVLFTIPSSWSSKPLIELHWDANNEGMVWTSDGKPLQGLTGGGERVEWIIPKEFRKYGETQTIYIEMACNGMFGNAPGGDSIQPPSPDKYFQLSEADLVSVNEDARALRYDFWIIGDAAREFPTDGWEQHRALQICNEIMDCFIAGDGSNASIKECRKIAKGYLGSDVDSAKVYDNDKPALVNGIGHCHIDTCWLWPWAETRRKVARSWSTQCNLLDRYPEHRFCASQAQQYKWLEELYPYAFDRVKSHVKDGRFQPIGGSWVEHDTNMPSGESLVRQFLYGQRYFESRFGERCRTFWLPDTFGYSSQLPQICRLAGMNRFFTQKLSWNNINNFPHTTFNWVSLDGSQVICHMAPSETYTAEAHFGDVKRSVTQHKSMDQDATSLLVFGKGDGGGGPTWGHIEKLRRCRGISDKIGLLPRVSMGGSVEDFFDRLEERAATGKTEFVTWYGELYFELHRGTYTTQANNKRNNRKSEVLLYDIEYLATLASIEGKSSYTYPKKEIDFMWESVLLCQFHDCLPGSSIEMCYDDSDELYAKVFETGGKVLKDALHALGFTDDDTTTPIALNTLGWQRDELPTYIDSTGSVSFANHTVGQPADARQISVTRDQVRVAEQENGVFVLDNAKLTVKVVDGAIVSLFDKKAGRESVPKGKKSNQFVIFDDKPLYWQAWDVEVFHLESRKELQASSKTTITSDSSFHAAVTTTTKISDKSWIKSSISLSKDSSYVEVQAEVEWHETMKFLKVEFPTNIVNTEASYETQYGIVRRPTHYNTSWDMAKFEVCCHKWADLSENGYGVSVLNESKYGFATCGSLMRLSLLRAPKAPDAHADMGRHNIRWAILPHEGALSSTTVRAGYNFNHPMTVHHHPTPGVLTNLMAAFKLLETSNPSLVVDCIKRAEDDADASNGWLPARANAKSADRHVILRTYDSLGGTSRGTIGFGPVKVAKAWKCNVLEDDLEELKLGKDGLDIELRAFEIATFKLLLA